MRKALIAGGTPVSERTDTDLVAGVLAGDRDAFAAVYDRYADRLHDFCWSVLRDQDEAADAVQDTFVLVAQRLAQLNDPERLRPWLYAVARSVALRRVRARRRVVLDEVGDMADTDPGPHRAAEQEALRELVWTAAGGLSERDRALLDLHLRQGLEGQELGQAMGVSANHAYVLLTRLRDQVERSLGALLIARLGREDCTELDTLLSGWDGKFSPILRKRVARHVDSCDVCSERRRVAVSPWALLAGVPLLPAPLFLKDRVMSEVQLVAMTEDLGATNQDAPTEQNAAPKQNAAANQALATEQDPTEQNVVTPIPPPKSWSLSRRARVAAAAAAVLALLAAGSAVVYLRTDPVEGEPLALENSVPLTTTTTSDTTTSPTPTTAPTPITTTTQPARRTTTTTPPRRTTTTTVVQPPPPPPPPPTTTTTQGDVTAPVITGASASPVRIFVSQCAEEQTQSTVSMTATDNVGVTSATLSWDGPGDAPGGSKGMANNGKTWTAVLGPFDFSGTVTWTVTATDAAGNTSSQRTGTISVTCPAAG
jgi:RNA polymerase sigma factor (sigma-70 family)